MSQPNIYCKTSFGLHNEIYSSKVISYFFYDRGIPVFGKKIGRAIKFWEKIDIYNFIM